MTLDKFSTLLYIIIIIIVSNVEAANSCIKQWKDMQAYNAEGKAFFSIFEIDLFDYNIGSYHPMTKYTMLMPMALFFNFWI